MGPSTTSCQQGEPTDQGHKARAVVMPDVLDQPLENKDRCLTSALQCHRNVSSGQPYPGTIQGKEFWETISSWPR